MFIFIFLFSSDLFSKENNVYDIISKNSNLSTFKDYLDKTGLDNVFKKKIPYNWTIYAPSNKAFENTPKQLEKLILKDIDYSKRLLTDHILTKEILASDFTEQITTEVTVSNKPIKLYRSENLFVKDVVVVKEDLIAENGVIHIIDCIMFIQPSFQDSRLSQSQKDSFPITSCCMQTENEVLLWKQNTKNIVY
ncbi:fasciclin domain-containing protein [Alphaproteobacteria bacterium]|nr:fasciclin domain-containing protein [Alphaproteobacteria bacterium]